jgi:hypothetical protein
MPEYLAPGVYMEERDDGPKPIEGVGTAMPAFIGFTERAHRYELVDGERKRQDYPGSPELVTSWNQYLQKFGDFVPGTFLPLAVYGYFQNGGTRCYVISVKQFPPAKLQLQNTKGEPALLVTALKTKVTEPNSLQIKVTDVQPPAMPASQTSTGSSGSGQPQVSGSASSSTSPEVGFTLEVWRDEKRIEVLSVVMAENPDSGLVKIGLKGGRQFVSDYVALSDYEYRPDTKPAKKSGAKDKPETKTKKRLEDAVPAALESLTSLAVDTESRNILPGESEYQGNLRATNQNGEPKPTGIEALEALDDVTMMVIPDLMTQLNGAKPDEQTIINVQQIMFTHCAKMQDRVAILDVPLILDGMNVGPLVAKEYRRSKMNIDSSYAALYYPWIKVVDPATNQTIDMPPSGHIAGIWARNDITRGVHKAPANEVVRGAVGLAYNMTKGEQEVLNPEGVNCIRSFPGMGIRVWGARTLSSNPSWRYLNVRRLFNYAEKSIERGTQWVVFEPNDHRLWGKVRRDVTAFLLTMWRDGMLFGLSPEEAFFVRCDETTNPRESRDLGRLIVEIGMAPVKPAEFVIFRISQWAGPGAEE